MIFSAKSSDGVYARGDRGAPPPLLHVAAVKLAEMIVTEMFNLCPFEFQVDRDTTSDPDLCEREFNSKSSILKIDAMNILRYFLYA